MSTYWLTFRLERNGSYESRYEALTEAIRRLTTKWWIDPTSFLLFESGSDIDTIAQAAKRCVDPLRDVVLIGMTEFKPSRVIGVVKDQDLFQLMPDVKKV